MPDKERVRKNVVGNFCHYVHFFRSADAAAPWLSDHPAAFLLSLDDAYALGRALVEYSDGL